MQKIKKIWRTVFEKVDYFFKSVILCIWGEVQRPDGAPSPVLLALRRRKADGHLEAEQAPHPPNLSASPTHPITHDLSAFSFFRFDSFRRWNRVVMCPKTWMFDEHVSHYLIDHSNKFFLIDLQILGWISIYICLHHSCHRSRKSTV